MSIETRLANSRKLDSQTTLGLAGTNNSTAYRIHEVERHLHSYENWFEVAATPSGETHIADRIGTGAGAFQVDAGNDTWGAWLQIIGSSDTPSVAGNVKYDLHRFEFTSAERNAVYFVQFAFGETGAGALTSNDYTEAVLKPASNQIDSGPVLIQARRKTAGTKVWARTMCPGNDTGTLDFYFGLHEYEG